MSRVLVLAAVLAAFALLSIAPLGAQSKEPPVGAKVRVRVSGEDGQRFEGWFRAHSGDSIAIADDKGRTRRIAMRDVSSIERSLGRSRSAGAGRGALWGMGAMLPLAFAGYSSAQCPGGEPNGAWCGSDWGLGIGGALLALGAGTGALVGAAIGHERWESVGLPAHIALSPTRGGVRAGLRLEF